MNIWKIGHKMFTFYLQQQTYLLYAQMYFHHLFTNTSMSICTRVCARACAHACMRMYVCMYRIAMLSLRVLSAFICSDWRPLWYSFLSRRSLSYSSFLYKIRLLRVDWKAFIVTALACWCSGQSLLESKPLLVAIRHSLRHYLYWYIDHEMDFF